MKDLYLLLLGGREQDSQRNHPRRTGEAYINQYWNAQFIENNPIPKELSFPKIWAWYDQLKQVEERHQNTHNKTNSADAKNSAAD